MSFFKLVKNSMGYDLEAPSYTVTHKIDEFTELRKYTKGKLIYFYNLNDANQAISENTIQNTIFKRKGKENLGFENPKDTITNKQD